MTGLLAAVAVLLTLWLIQAPGWLRIAFFSTGALLVAGLVVLSGPDRALAPTALFALALGLLVTGPSSGRRSRVAPAKRKPPAPRRRPGGNAAGFDSFEIPGYEILEKVGSGGMASVYRARRQSGGQIVALKIPMEQYVADAKFIRRFHREAEVAQRLNHVNIVRTHEHGSLGVRHYMVMEYVDGRSLESYIEAGELEPGLIVDIMKLVVSALQHIHSAGIIHRDIKPANIMILEGGIRRDGPDGPRLAPDAVKLMDFGIAGGKVLSKLTMTGARIGTPVYMSPEQARGLKIDHRSDIYSLGLVFYEMLTGETAFKGGYEAIVHQQIFQSPPPPRQLDVTVPKSLDELVMRMIAKDPDERPSLEDVHAALEGVDLTEEAQAELPCRILVTASARQGVLRILDTEGSLHASLGEIGSEPGSFSAAPLSVSLDSAGNIFAAVFEYQVGKTENRMIHKLAPDGTPLSSFGTYGMRPGEFLYPVSLAVAPDDTLYVLDGESHQVQKFDSEGRHLFAFGGRGEGRGMFNEPRHIVVGSDGMVYVLDYGNRQVQRFGPDGTYQTRWAFKLGNDQDGMRLLDGLAVDAEGNLFISDRTGGKVRKVNREGKLVRSYTLESGADAANDGLLDLGVDEFGNLYAARRGGRNILKYEPGGRLVATLSTYVPVVQMIVDVRAAREAVQRA